MKIKKKKLSLNKNCVWNLDESMHSFLENSTMRDKIRGGEDIQSVNCVTQYVPPCATIIPVTTPEEGNTEC